MRIFIDEDIPNELSPLFRVGGNEVAHIEDVGLKGTPNGKLLPIISGKYDVFVTGDTNLRFQQNLRKFDFAVILLRPKLLIVEQIKPLIGPALAAIPGAPKHEVTVIQPQVEAEARQNATSKKKRRPTEDVSQPTTKRKTKPKSS